MNRFSNSHRRILLCDKNLYAQLWRLVGKKPAQPQLKDKLGSKIAADRSATYQKLPLENGGDLVLAIASETAGPLVVRLRSTELFLHGTEEIDRETRWKFELAGR